MKRLLFLFLTFISFSVSASDRYIFFLHNRFVEMYDLSHPHPQYGVAQYNQIISKFEKKGFNVISEKRNGSIDPIAYAQKVKLQIDSLLDEGVKAEHITVVGTSKGGYIAQYVSTFAHNPSLNFVFIASFRNDDIERLSDINFCGNILTIYEKSDALGVSALARKETSTCEIRHFKEIELHTGLKHGFQFKALDIWLDPVIAWANANYELN